MKVSEEIIGRVSKESLEHFLSIDCAFECGGEKFYLQRKKGWVSLDHWDKEEECWDRGMRTDSAIWYVMVKDEILNRYLGGEE